MPFSWKNVQKPIVGLGAMDGVTDCAMRQITCAIGHPDFCMTEFTSSDGLSHGVRKLLRDFAYTQEQRPVIAQLFGANPDTFYTAALVACHLGFDGIDINMGCPADSATKKGGGAALIRTPELAQKIIQSVKQAVRDWSLGKNVDAELSASFELKQAHFDRHVLPVSVKTRIGYDKPVTKEWTRALLATGIDLLTLHGRTLEQQYSGKADWAEIATAAQIVHDESDTLILGNGDLLDQESIHRAVDQSGVDGVWIGRGALGNPWIFTDHEPTWDEKKSVMIQHARLFEEYNQTLFAHDPYPFLNMRKHFGWYVKGIPGAAALRARLFQVNNSNELEVLLSS